MSKRPSKVPETATSPPAQQNAKKDEAKANNNLSAEGAKGQTNAQKSSVSIKDPSQKSNTNIAQPNQGGSSAAQGKSITNIQPSNQSNSKIASDINGQQPQQSSQAIQSKSQIPVAQQGQPSNPSQSLLDPKSAAKESSSSITSIPPHQAESSQERVKNKNISSKQTAIIVTGEKNIKTDLQTIEEKPQKKNILHESGLVHAYDYFLRQLCRNGLPSGNIFEYAAQEVLKFEKMKKQDSLKKLQQRSSSPLNKSSVYSHKENNRANDSIERVKQGSKDSQFLKEVGQKNKEDATPPNQGKQKDSKVEEKKPAAKGDDKKVVSKDKVREEQPEKKKQGDKDDKNKQQEPATKSKK